MTILYEPAAVATGELVPLLDGEVRAVHSLPELLALLDARPGEATVVLGPGVALAEAVTFAEQQRLARPGLGLVLVRLDADITVQALTELVRAGIREVVPTGDLAGLADACRRSHRTVGQLAAAAEPARTGKIITVFASKGGCGKTTLATNLAVALSTDRGRRVALVDLDLAFGDVAISLQLPPHRTIMDAVTLGRSLDPTAVAGLLTPWQSGLQCVLAPVAPGDAEKVPAALVTDLLGVLRGMMDYVVVDTPPQLSEHVLAALDVSDLHVLLTTPDVPALKNLRLTLDMLDLLSYDRGSRAVVLNRAGAKVGLTAADIERVVAAPLTGQVPSSREVPASINRGVPIVVDSPNHPVSVSIRKLAGWCTAGAGPGVDAADRAGVRLPMRSRRRSA